MTRRSTSRIAALTVALAASASPAAFAFEDKVEAGSCAIATNGIATNNSVTCNFGLTPEQLRQATEAAMSLGNEGGALVVIADRSNDVIVAEIAVRQIDTAYETLRLGGLDQWSAYFEAQLARAHAIRDRLTSVAKP